MSAIVQTLLNVFTRFFDFLRFLWSVFAGWIQVVWSAAVTVLDTVLSALAQIFIFGIGAVTDVLLFVVGLAVAILPPIPETPHIGSIDLGMANRYVPITEVVALGSLWAVIFGGIGLYKLAKFVRGAG